MISTVIIRDVKGQTDALRLLTEQNAPSVNVLASLSYSEADIRLVNQLQPTLVIMDLNGPNHDRFSLLDDLQYRNFFLVYFTAHFGDGRKFPCCGVDYLLKPADHTEFDLLIASILRRLPFREYNPARIPVKDFNNAYTIMKQDLQHSHRVR